MTRYVNLRPGDPAPWFRQRSTSNPDYTFESAAGRYLVLCCFISAGHEVGRRMLTLLDRHRALFDDDKIAFFGVSHDIADENEGRVRESMPGIRFFWDQDGRVGRLYGTVPADASEGTQTVSMRPVWYVIDPNMRIRAVFEPQPDGSDVAALAAYLADLPPVDMYAGIPIQAPVIVLPQVFEPEFCRELIMLYKKNGGTESGFMREQDGRTVATMDYGHKRRSDYMIEDEALRRTIQQKITRRVVPEIRRVHQYQVTRMERYLVGCYDSETGGHFRPHRDNTTKGTAHRRFAMSINLNAEFDGGEVSFPEFGSRSFKPPVGGAVVFSCSLLHAVSKVTAGRRYAFLPFMYDDAAAAIREANIGFLEDGKFEYSKDQPHGNA